MTCIVGVEHDGRAWLGGDSAGLSGWDLTVRADTKVFTAGPFVMGFTTSFRMGQILRYGFVPPAHPARVTDERYMAAAFVDAVRAALKAGGFGKTDSGRDEGGTFLVGYRGRVYGVHNDFQVARAARGFTAVGCGAAYAIGFLHAPSRTDVRRRITGALRVAEQNSGGVRGPFRIVAEPLGRRRAP